MLYNISIGAKYFCFTNMFYIHLLPTQMRIPIDNFSGKVIIKMYWYRHVYTLKHAAHRNSTLHLACICF